MGSSIQGDLPVSSAVIEGNDRNFLYNHDQELKFWTSTSSWTHDHLGSPLWSFQLFCHRKDYHSGSARQYSAFLHQDTISLTVTQLVQLTVFEFITGPQAADQSTAEFEGLSELHSYAPDIVPKAYRP